MFNDVIAYYESFREQERLERGIGLLEFERTLDVFRRTLPAPPATILDVGGGPGVYACRLAAQGYETHLIDPVPMHIQQARWSSSMQPSHPVKSIEIGDARQLTQVDSSADAVLFMGPLYHLTKFAERQTALAEARRVLKPGGVLIASAICRYASLFDGLHRGLMDDPRFPPILHADLKTGLHRNVSGNPEFFTEAYFHQPEELREEIRSAGFYNVRVLAAEGPGWLASDLDRRLGNPKELSQLLELLRELEAVPELLAASPHLLVSANT
jgi:ubiquinone/menaquinone biosynthesis C-methylase UbiE